MGNNTAVSPYFRVPAWNNLGCHSLHLSYFMRILKLQVMIRVRWKINHKTCLWFNLLTHSSSHHKNGNKSKNISQRENVIVWFVSRPSHQMLLQFRSLFGSH